MIFLTFDQSYVLAVFGGRISQSFVFAYFMVIKCLLLINNGCLFFMQIVDVLDFIPSHVAV